MAQTGGSSLVSWMDCRLSLLRPMSGPSRQLLRIPDDGCMWTCKRPFSRRALSVMSLLLLLLLHVVLPLSHGVVLPC